jgi:hypothetical protein
MWPMYFFTQVAVFTGNIYPSPPILADPVADIGGIATPDERPARLNAGTYSVIETRVVVNSWAVSWIMKSVGNRSRLRRTCSLEPLDRDAVQTGKLPVEQYLVTTQHENSASDLLGSRQGLAEAANS